MGKNIRDSKFIVQIQVLFIYCAEDHVEVIKDSKVFWNKIQKTDNNLSTVCDNKNSTGIVTGCVIGHRNGKHGWKHILVVAKNEYLKRYYSYFHNSVMQDVSCS
jgi:hypothetical protein